MYGRTSFSVIVSGLIITVTADSPAESDLLNRYLLPWLPRYSGYSDADGVVFCVEHAGDQGCFAIKRGASIISNNVAETDLFTRLQQAVDEVIITRLAACVAVHAGVVVFQGRAIVLPGSSHVGKTRLVRELIARGAQYSSDEFAMLDAAGRVHPWPRALMVRNERQRQRPILATELGAEVQRDPARVALVVLLKYRPGAMFDVHPLTGSDTVIRLLTNTPHILADDPNIIRPLAAACSVGLGFEGVRGEAAEAAEKLIQLVRAS